MTKRLACASIVAVVFALLSSCTTKHNPHYNFKKSGKGGPIVILESGLGDHLKGWEEVQKEVAKVTTVISYDRLGIGKSDSASAPRTVEQFTLELNEFIKYNQFEGPFIFVGHSLGGFIIRKYQQQYPEKVSALVLVDGSLADWEDAFEANRTPEEYAQFENLFLAHRNSLPQTARAEYDEMDHNFEVMKSVPIPQDIPCYFLVSTLPNSAITQQDIESKIEIVKQLTKDCPNASIKHVPSSGHYIHLEDPDLVVHAILETVMKVQLTAE